MLGDISYGRSTQRVKDFGKWNTRGLEHPWRRAHAARFLGFLKENKIRRLIYVLNYGCSKPLAVQFPEDFIVQAFVKGARCGNAHHAELEGSTAVFSKRRYRDGRCGSAVAPLGPPALWPKLSTPQVRPSRPLRSICVILCFLTGISRWCTDYFTHWIAGTERSSASSPGRAGTRQG